MVQQSGIRGGRLPLQRTPSPGPRIFGGDGSSGTVELFFYGDLESWAETRAFRSPPGYPRLTDYGLGSSQEEASRYTGTPIRPSLTYRYRLTVDAAYFQTHFTNTGTRHGYSEYVTKQDIPRSYLENVGSLKTKSSTSPVTPPAPPKPPAPPAKLPTPAAPVIPGGSAVPAGKVRSGSAGGTLAPLAPPAKSITGVIDTSDPKPPAPTSGGPVTSGTTAGGGTTTPKQSSSSGGTATPQRNIGGGGLRGAGGTVVTGLLAGAAVLAAPAIKAWFAKNYLHEKWAAEEREMIAKAIENNTWRYNVLISTKRQQIDSERAAGRPVTLHVVVDTKFTETDFGPAMTEATVTDYVILFQGDTPIEWPLFQPKHGSVKVFFKAPKQFFRRQTYDFAL